MNFYPFHIGDYLSHTAHLTDAEDLAYRRMIDLYYQTEAGFVDLNMVARKVRASLDVVQTIAAEFFTLIDGVYRHTRCDEEIEMYRRRLEVASRAGKASAERRLNVRSTTVQPTKNQEPITKNQEKPIKRASALSDEFAPTAEHAALAKEISVNLGAEFEKFKDYHRAKGSTMKDWNAALRTWIRNAAEFSRGKTAVKTGYVHDISKMNYTKGINDDGSF